VQCQSDPCRSQGPQGHVPSLSDAAAASGDDGDLATPKAAWSRQRLSDGEEFFVRAHEARALQRLGVQDAWRGDLCSAKAVAIGRLRSSRGRMLLKKGGQRKPTLSLGPGAGQVRRDRGSGPVEARNSTCSSCSGRVVHISTRERGQELRAPGMGRANGTGHVREPASPAR